MSSPCTKRELPLSTTFEDGSLCIRIGINTLVTTITEGPLWPHARIVDAEALGPALATELERDEDESGLTMLMKSIDRAAERLVENCHPSIEWSEDIAEWPPGDRQKEKEDG